MKFDVKELNALGKKWVRYVQDEIRKDATKSSFIPKDPEFAQSFSYAVEPGGLVVLYSSWPHLEVITNGTRGRYKMAWLTQQAGINVVPLVQQDGSVQFRTAPLTVGQAWIHPKIAKHTFINRAYERAFQEHVDQIIGSSLQTSLGKKKKR